MLCCLCVCVQRERSRSPLNLVLSPSSRRSTDSVEQSPPVSDHHGPAGSVGGGTSAAAASSAGGAPSASSSAKARLHDFFCVTDTSAGILEVCRCLVHPEYRFVADLLFVPLDVFYRTMQYSAKLGLAIACRLSVCPSVLLSVTLVDQDHIG